MPGLQEVDVDEPGKLLGDHLDQGSGQSGRRRGARLRGRRQDQRHFMGDDGVDHFQHLRGVTERAYRPARNERGLGRSLRSAGDHFRHSEQLRHRFLLEGVDRHVLRRARQAGVELVDVDDVERHVARHHRTHVEMDVVQAIDQAADVEVVGEPGCPHVAVQVHDVDGLAAGAHVDAVAADQHVVLGVASGQQHLVGGDGQGVLDHLVIDVDAVVVGIDTAAGLAEDLAARAFLDLDAGAFEDGLGGIDDAPDVTVGKRAEPAAGRTARGGVGEFPLLSRVSAAAGAGHGEHRRLFKMPKEGTVAPSHLFHSRHPLRRWRARRDRWGGFVVPSGISAVINQKRVRGERAPWGTICEAAGPPRRRPAWNSCRGCCWRSSWR